MSFARLMALSEQIGLSLGGAVRIANTVSTPALAHPRGIANFAFAGNLPTN